MKFVVTLLVSLAMAAHAAFGCCAHHNHTPTAKNAAVCCEHHAHGHHNVDTSASSEESPVPERCEEETCVFAVQSSPLSALDFNLVAAPLFAATPVSLDVDAVTTSTRVPVEDSLHPSGPALHLWQCVLVV